MYKNIGIVIATKKYSSNLNKTIKSIFAQSYLPTEFIIVSGKKIENLPFYSYIYTFLTIDIIHIDY